MEKRLGKGLEALIPSIATSTPGQELLLLEPKEISANPYQPRTEFDQTKLDELAQSIKLRGVLQPVLVRKKDNTYELVSGERRLRAAQLAGLERIPAVLADRLSKEAIMEMSLIENLQREDLNPIDRANGFKNLMTEFNLTQEIVAERIGVDRSVVANSVRLLNLPENIQQWVKEGKLMEGHARVLLSAKDLDFQNAIASQIVSNNLTIRRAESMIRTREKRRLVIKSGSNPPTAISAIEQKLKEFFGTQVKITRGKRSGKIEIAFAGDSELNRILELLKVYV